MPNPFHEGAGSIDIELLEIEGKLSVLQQKIQLIPKDDWNRPCLVALHSLLLLDRSQHIKRFDDVDQAIGQLEDVLKDIDEYHRQKYLVLFTLYSAHVKRFERKGHLTDISRMIACCHEALASDLSLCTRDQKINFVYWLGAGYTLRSGRWSHQGDLDSAMHYLAIAILLKPNDKAMPFVLNEVGVVLRHRFVRFGELRDINHSIALQKHAIHMQSRTGENLHEWLQTISLSMRARFERTNDLDDIKHGIEYAEQSLKLIPQDDPGIVPQFNSLAGLLFARFQHTARLSDLDDSIRHLHAGLELALPEGPPRRDTLGALAYFLQERFLVLKNPTDIIMSISYHQQTIQFISLRGDPVPSETYNNFGMALFYHYEHSKNVDDLSQSISYLRKALDSCPVDQPHRSRLLNNLGNLLLEQFRISQSILHLDESIDFITQAISASLQLEGQAHVAGWFGNLGNAYQHRFDHLKQLEDLDLAIRYYRQSVRLFPEDHLFRAKVHLWLARSYRCRFGTMSSKYDDALSIECYRKAAETPSGSAEIMMQAAREWAQFHRPNKASLKPYQMIIDLLPRVVWLGVPIDRRYKSMESIGDVVNEAAAAAIEFGEYSLALEWLETGRSMVWSQMLQLRTPLDELANVRPDIAARLREIARVIEAASSVGSNSSSRTGHTLSSEKSTQTHRRMAEEWDQRIKEARSVPGFKGFMQPKRATELVRAAQSGPIVLINVHETRCDALIILPRSHTIKHLSLSHYSVSKARTARDQLVQSLRSEGIRGRGFKPSRPEAQNQSATVLADLWTDVVQPVLEALEYMHTVPPSTEMPHVTWCTTGYLSFLPIHAAGICGRPGSRVFDYVVSSYTPTLGTLLGAHRKANDFQGMLVVGQSETPGCSTLSHVPEEIQSIKTLVGEIGLVQLNGSDATTESVLAAMKEHSWVHLACHAKQDMDDPRASGFLLHDRTLDLSMITNKPLQNAEFAFLSACQTATGDERLPEESVHLAAGMIMAGYSSVVATMWSIQDSHAPMVADRVYAHMLKDGVPDSRKAAVALHEAVKSLRDKIGEKEYGSWVPYIHLGA